MRWRLYSEVDESDSFSLSISKMQHFVTVHLFAQKNKKKERKKERKKNGSFLEVSRRKMTKRDFASYNRQKQDPCIVLWI